MSARIRKIQSIVRKSHLSQIVRADLKKRALTPIDVDRPLDFGENEDEDEALERRKEKRLNPATDENPDELLGDVSNKPQSNRSGIPVGEEVPLREYLNRVTPKHNEQARETKKSVEFQRAVDKYIRLLKKLRKGDGDKNNIFSGMDLLEQIYPNIKDEAAKLMGGLSREQIKYNEEAGKEQENFRGEGAEMTIGVAVAKYKRLLEDLKENEAEGGKAFDTDLIKEEMEELKADFPQLPELISTLEKEDAEFEAANPTEEPEEVATESPSTIEEPVAGLSKEEKKELDQAETTLAKQTAEITRQIKKNENPAQKEALTNQLVSLQEKYIEVRKKIDGDVYGTLAAEIINIQQNISIETDPEVKQGLEQQLAQKQEEIKKVIKERGGNRSYEFLNEDQNSSKFTIDDVLSLANEMYTDKEAKSAMNHMPLSQLYELVKKKITEMGLDKEEAEEETVNSYLTMRRIWAAKKKNEEVETEDDSEEKREDDSSFGTMDEDQLKSLSIMDKIEMCNYVELFALLRYLNKISKKKTKNVEDEPVNPDELAKSIGRPKPPVEHGKGKSILKNLSPEDLKRYENMRASGAKFLSMREAADCMMDSKVIPSVQYADPMERARRAIERQDPICFDVAAEHGQMFDNVKHMKWFVTALAEEME